MRLLYAVLLLTALLVGCAVGCTVGPAANRADRQGERGAEPEPSGGVPEPSKEPEREPEPEPAPGNGDLTITAILPTGLPDPCCLAELPSGDLLIGTRDSGAIHRLNTTTGDVTELGTLSGVAYAPDRVLLALAVKPGASDAQSLFAYYTEGQTATIASYGYDEAERELYWSPSTLVSELARPETESAALAFGPDGLLYAGTATGEILRMTSIGWIPDDNPVPGSFTYATAPGGGVTGLAWDANGRLWAATTSHVTTPGELPLCTVPPGERVTGLAYAPATGSLWLSTGTGTGTDTGNGTGTSTGNGLWHIPLDGGSTSPELFPLDAPPLALIADRQGSGLWVLTADGAVAKASVR